MTKQQLEEIVEKLQISTYTNYELIAITEQETDKVDRIIKPEGKIFENYNKAVLIANGRYFMIVDENLISIDKKSYVEDLLGICQDNNVGIVGTKLYNKEEQVEHGGIIVGMNGAGDFLYKGAPKDAGTYMQRLLIIHNLSCVYVKYAMIDKDIFMQIGKFTDEFTGLLISIDTCLKMLASGKQVVINPIISICVDKLEQVEKIEHFIDDVTLKNIEKFLKQKST